MDRSDTIEARTRNDAGRARRTARQAALPANFTLTMAYMNQERKASIAPRIKTILKRYGLKGSLSVRNHSTLVLTIKSGKIDFIQNYNETIDDRQPYSGIHRDKYLDVNPYHYQNHFTGRALKCLTEVFDVMNAGNWDKSDPQTDYFNVGWYVDVNVGKWNKPYEVVG